MVIAIQLYMVIFKRSESDMSSQIVETFKELVEFKNLSRTATAGAFSEIMSGVATSTQIGAWMTALRMKGETSDEIAGCIDVMRKEVQSIKCLDPLAVDSVGTGGDGAHTINVSTTAAIVAAGAGVTVAKHGNRAVSSRSGSADVLAALGINLEMSVEKMEQALELFNFSFLFAPKLHPAMKHAIGPRRELGIRTVFNLLGPMTNPAGVKRGVIGVFNQHYCRLLAEAAAKTNCVHTLFVSGSDGLDEITLTGPTTMITVRDGNMEEEQFDPRFFGFDYCRPQDLVGGTAEENAAIICKLLQGELFGPKRDIVLLNSAAVLLASEKYRTWPLALSAARHSIDSGAAYGLLKKYGEFSFA